MDLSKENTIELQAKQGKIHYLKFCFSCGAYFTTKRVDKLTCSTSCKQRLTLRLKKGLEPIINRNMRDKPNKALLKKFGFENYQE